MDMLKWKLIVSRRVSVFRAFVMAEGSRKEMKKYLGVEADALVTTKDELSNYHLKFSDLKTISMAVISRIRENADFPKQHVEDCLNVCQKLVSVSKSSSDSNQIKENFEEYYKTYKEFVKFVIIPVAIEQAITKNITEFLVQKVGEEGAQNYLSKLTTPPKLPETNQEQVDLVKLAVKILQDKITNYEGLLHEHHEKYQWLSCYNIDEQPFQYSYFETRLQDLLKLGLDSLSVQLNEAEKRILNDEKEYQETLKELNVQGDLIGQIELLRQYVWLRTYRIERQSQSNFYVQPLFKQVASAHNRTLREIAALPPEEIFNLLAGKEIPNIQSLETRIKTYVLLSESGKTQFYTGEEGIKIANQELGEQKTDEVSSVKGMPAYKGTAKGVARVLTRKEQVSNFQEGEILITTMTSPEYVPAIKKAKAIVTDEGGVLCHAAIVAREFKIPCVIGTHNATSVFKSGDQIEVDAESGLVKKI